MNNKKLIAIIAGLVIVGGILVLSGNLGTKNQSNETKQIPVTNQNNPDGMRGKPITEKIETVLLQNSGFDPQTVTIKKGKYVIWINKSGSETAIKSDAYTGLNLSNFPNGSSVQFVFEKPGTYKYYNKLNPEQTGIVIVE